MSIAAAPGADEVKFAKALANPNKNVRDETLRSLRGYVKSNKKFKEMEVLKLWKALYYCLWLSDKQPIQDELAVSLANLVTAFSNVEGQIMYFEVFFKTILREWFYLDQYRVNKFYYLIRVMFNLLISFGVGHHWSPDVKQQLLTNVLQEGVLQKNPNGIRFHIADIFLTEVWKATVTESASPSDESVNVSNSIETAEFLMLLEPVVRSVVLRGTDQAYVERAIKEVLSNFVTEFSEFSESDKRDDSKESAPTRMVFANVSTLAVQKMIFDLAAEENTPKITRQKLYDVHREYALITKTDFATEDVVAQDIARLSSKTRKNDRGAARQGGGTDTSKSAKKRNRNAGQLSDTPSASKRVSDAETPVGKTKKLKTDTVNTITAPVTPASAKKVKSSKSAVVGAAKVTSNSNEEEPVNPAVKIPTSDKNEGYTPSFVASKKFTGARKGYVFKKDDAGLGYYLDIAKPSRKSSKSKTKEKSTKQPQQQATSISKSSSKKNNDKSLKKKASEYF